MANRTSAAVLLLATLLGGCQQSTLKVLIGGTAVPAPGAQPITDSIIVIAGSRIRSVGARRDTPVPQDSERADVAGKYIVPVAGGRLAPNETASLEVHTGSPDGPLVRRMEAGTWRD